MVCTCRLQESLTLDCAAWLKDQCTGDLSAAWLRQRVWLEKIVVSSVNPVVCELLCKLLMFFEISVLFYWSCRGHCWATCVSRWWAYVKGNLWCPRPTSLELERNPGWAFELCVFWLLWFACPVFNCGFVCYCCISCVGFHCSVASLLLC